MIRTSLWLILMATGCASSVVDEPAVAVEWTPCPCTVECGGPLLPDGTECLAPDIPNGHGVCESGRCFCYADAQCQDGASCSDGSDANQYCHNGDCVTVCE
jgi:hypothetical protein